MSVVRAQGPLVLLFDLMTRQLEESFWRIVVVVQGKGGGRKNVH